MSRVMPDSKASPNIQDVFLNYVRREKLTVTIRMMDGSELEGRIKNFDRFARDHRAERRRSHDLQARDCRDQDAEVGLELLLASVAACHRRSRRAIVIVLDSVGIGELPDAAGIRRPGQQHARQHRRARCRSHCRRFAVARPRSARRHRLEQPRRASPARAFGRHGGGVGRQGLGHRPLGDDGHRARSRRSRRFPNGFPAEIIAEFSRRDRPRRARQQGRVRAREIIDELGAEHMRTGALIVYTSADSVFQIAAHEDDRPDRRALPRLRDRLSSWSARAWASGASSRGRSSARRAASSAPPTAATTRCRRAARRCSIALKAAGIAGRRHRQDRGSVRRPRHHARPSTRRATTTAWTRSSGRWRLTARA